MHLSARLCLCSALVCLQNGAARRLQPSVLAVDRMQSATNSSDLVRTLGGLEGCAEEHTERIEQGVLTNHADPSEKKSVWFKSCRQCSAGYSEVMTAVALSRESDGMAAFAGVDADAWAKLVDTKYTKVVQRCVETRCGVDCRQCKKTDKWLRDAEYTCTRCRKTTVLGLAQLNKDGVCVRRRSGKWALMQQTPGVLAIKLFDLLTDELGPVDVLSFVQLLEAIGHKVQSALRDEYARKDLKKFDADGQAGFQEEFIKDIIHKAVEQDNIPPRGVTFLKRQLAHSQPVVQLRGGLGLCIEIAFNEHGRQHWPAPASEQMSEKDRCAHDLQWDVIRARCTTMSSVLAHVQAAIDTLSKDLVDETGNDDRKLEMPPLYNFTVHTPETRPFKLVVTADAPRRTVIDVLDMIGAFKPPEEVVPPEDLNSGCGR